MKNILVVFGTRPEVIKLAPLVLELRKNGYRVCLCNTEQQKELAKQTLVFFGLDANISLDVMQPNQSLIGLQARLLDKLGTVLSSQQFDATIVQGDTMSAFTGALASFYSKVPVFHIEAGLRSYSLVEPFPEEALRQMISRIASLHFAPTLKAVTALKQEGIPEKLITLTGNTVIDALECLTAEASQNAICYLDAQNIILNENIVLVTAHRRENHGDRLDRIIQAIKYLSEQYPYHQFVLPVHPNPNVKHKILDGLQALHNIRILPPADYPVLVALMKHAKLILTDSGGIQEEAPSFGVPVLIMRYETERKEGVEAGLAKLVGADFHVIIKEAAKILKKSPVDNKPQQTANPYGDGHASSYITQAITTFFDAQAYL